MSSFLLPPFGIPAYPRVRSLRADGVDRVYLHEDWGPQSARSQKASWAQSFGDGKGGEGGAKAGQQASPKLTHSARRIPALRAEGAVKKGKGSSLTSTPVRRAQGRAPHHGEGGAPFVVALHRVHPPPRYDLRETGPGGERAGEREVLGRCLTHALMDGACWLLWLPAGHRLYDASGAPISSALRGKHGRACVRFRQVPYSQHASLFFQGGAAVNLFPGSGAYRPQAWALNVRESCARPRSTLASPITATQFDFPPPPPPSAANRAGPERLAGAQRARPQRRCPPGGQPLRPHRVLPVPRDGRAPGAAGPPQP